MNPLDWEAVQRLQRNLHPNHQTAVHNNNNNNNNTMENTSGTPNDWDTYCQYSSYPVDEPPSSTGVSSGSHLGPPSPNAYAKETEEDEDPDGEPMADEDPELTRKRKELQAIEEQILRKKVAIALKTVEPFVKGTSPQGFPSNEESAASQSLKDRVNVILQQRRPVGSLSKVQSREDRLKSSSLSKDSLLRANHPLMLRVRAIMMQRCSEPCVIPTNEEAPHVAPPPPSRSVASPAKEGNGVNQGFQRFLSVLNKGVDMDLLSRIVNDDSVDLPLGGRLLNIQPPAVENKSDPPFRSESQRSNSGASQPGHSRTDSGERKSQEKSLYRLSLPGGDKKKSDTGDLCFGSSSRSKSPPAVKKTKKEVEKPKVDEQCAQLQNVLKSLGLSLEAEEMSKLSDRTQLRLYGKKSDGTRVDSRGGEQESREKGPQRRQSRNSSSSSASSSSSSRSTSRSCSSSPSRPQRSRSGDLKQRRRSKHSRSRSRSGSRDRAQRHRDRDKKDSKETATYQCPYPPDQTYPHPHPSDSSRFPDYSLSQYSECHAYDSGSYSAATTSYWTYTQGAIPPSTYPSVHPYPQDTYSHFPDAGAAPSAAYPHHEPLEDISFLVNPDLSKSEGQTGFTSGPRCLQVISTKQPTQSFVKQVTKAYRPRKRNFRRQRYRQKQKHKRMKALQRAQDSPQRSEDSSKAKEPEEKKKQSRTEEEIKANLRKTLDAFNQKAKQKLTETLAHSEWLKSMEHHEHLQTEPAANPDTPCGPHF